MLIKMVKFDALSGFGLVALCLGLAGCSQTATDHAGKSRVRPVQSNVAPQLANACEIAAANRYYLPRRVIHAYHAAPSPDGSVIVKLKADLREAICTVNASGTIRSVVDVSPKSADQLAAEAAAAGN